MPIYEQVPIRLKINLASNPPEYPLDANTGSLPRFWRSQAIKLNLGLFDAFGAPVDISNLDYLQVHLFRSANDFVPLVSKTVTDLDSSWRPVITDSGWQDGTQQNASVTLDPADTDQGLYGTNYASFWLVVQGKTDEEVVLTYAAGPCVIYNASSALPVGPTNYVSFHEQEQSTGDSAITPLSMQHLEVVEVIGLPARAASPSASTASWTARSSRCSSTCPPRPTSPWSSTASTSPKPPSSTSPPTQASTAPCSAPTTTKARSNLSKPFIRPTDP